MHQNLLRLHCSDKGRWTEIIGPALIDYVSSNYRLLINIPENPVAGCCRHHRPTLIRIWKLNGHFGATRFWWTLRSDSHADTRLRRNGTEGSGGVTTGGSWNWDVISRKTPSVIGWFETTCLNNIICRKNDLFQLLIGRNRRFSLYLAGKVVLYRF